MALRRSLNVLTRELDGRFKGIVDNCVDPQLEVIEGQL